MPPKTRTPETSSSPIGRPAAKRTTVSPAHTLTRVRNNQRRHRERRRDYIASLEKSLEDANRVMEEMKKELDASKAELEKWRGGSLRVETGFVALGHDINTSKDLGFTSEGAGFNKPDAVFHQQLPVVPEPCLQQCQLQYPQCAFPPPSSNSASSPSLAIRYTEDPELLALMSSNSPSCVSFPAEGRESTTPCTQAYVLISQQNYRGLDVHTIRTWLYEGFRQAQNQHDGCSVDNKLLFGLLDFISGV
ncbi:uncharacterized protein BDZ99DRAFT_284392 [Mytilinidion resinicola]|uniref:BZIP domain-containing protein n=1 Tax=Mytilinidion resinicola TaxID=574789 RepID=A0A6A6YVE8_9PEZI|nr:uncharacterized protein BDZ99DRAFT_284392 [Mytilinidion resinicola]KAF2811964.1 hypothetical protein BDZ99DRAFT_284392 [Mytilinidion resinicola]